MPQVKKKTGNKDDDGVATSKKASIPVSGVTVKSKQKEDTSASDVVDLPESDNPFESLTLFRETPLAEHPYLFRQKLAACSTVYDFSNNSYMQEKEAKRHTLLEMVQYANDTRNCFNEGLMQDVVFMTSHNIFRSLPCRRRWITPFLDPDTEEPTFDAAWLHLQLVYELFLRFIVSNDVDPKLAKRYIDGNFILKLLELFDSEDARERDYLKTILHRTYGKFMALRSFIRRSITHVFYQAIYESSHRNGLCELLEILGSIINGFALPLKEEHRDFLIQGLIPLHKVRHVASFHQQLSYCMVQYAEKDSRLTVNIIEALLRFWPNASTSKQVQYLNELEELLELIQPPEFAKLKDPIFKRIAQCIRCSHFQIAERALFLWNNDIILKLLAQHRMSLYPVVIAALYDNSRNHWNVAVHGLTFNVLKLLMENDADLFNECSKANEKEKPKKTHAEREVIWHALEARFESALKTGEKPPERKHNTRRSFRRQSTSKSKGSLSARRSSSARPK
eukprot:GEMP01014624.1.p1 GENE.GEMP01014624.1~~GEMP01014624.1.p1  ORF type:complete len:508 (+),score=104.12 GEMP01014624.1:246-1769(+)